jgi:hypothetical protein
MWQWLRDFFGGCLHAHATFPIGGHGCGPTVVCLGCGRRFAYDWERMRRGGEVKS